MNKLYLLISFCLLLACCKKEITKEIPESTLVEFEYPSGSGHSGDTLTSVLGYGYDATGLLDTLSVRAKVLTLPNKNYLGILTPNSAGANQGISGISFQHMLWSIQDYPNRVSEPYILIVSHIKALLKLSNKSDSIDLNCAYAYYAYNIITSSFFYHIDYSDIDSEITPEFKNDVNSLTSAQIVKKYGTHVLWWINVGTKFEVLYKCDSNSNNTSEVEQGLYKRMKEFIGQTPGILPYDEGGNYSRSNEQLIYNSIGSKIKLSGVINASDNNPKGIFVNIHSLVGDNVKFQFMGVGKDGAIALYDLVNDPIKKQELKNYIDLYVSEK